MMWKISAVLVSLALMSMMGVYAQPLIEMPEDMSDIVSMPVDLLRSLIDACKGIIPIEDLEEYLEVVMRYPEKHITTALNLVLIENVLLLIASFLLPVIGTIVWVCSYPLIGLPLSVLTFFFGFLYSVHKYTTLWI